MKFNICLFFLKLLIKFKFRENLTVITGTLYEVQYTFNHTSLSSSYNGKISDKSCRESRNTNFIFNICSENRTVYEILWKNIGESGRSQKTIRHMRIACLTPKATNTHSQYVILLFHCNSGCTNTPECYVIVRCLSCFIFVWVAVFLDFLYGDITISMYGGRPLHSCYRAS
jgi:hypothetical protein